MIQFSLASIALVRSLRAFSWVLAGAAFIQVLPVAAAFEPKTTQDSISEFRLEERSGDRSGQRGNRGPRPPGNGVVGREHPISLDCMDGGKVLPVDNQVVLRWKSNTQNGWHARAHVEGTISRIFPVRNDHDHFEIQIGPNRDDVLEVVYNNHFGALPEVREGDRVEACGDFINAFDQNGPYSASPSGAIIHWVHMNPKNRGHEHGYVLVNGEMYGNRYRGGGRH